MKPTIASHRAHDLLPLLRAIGEEILERAARVEHLASMSHALSISPRVHADEIGLLQADLAAEKRELRHAEEELGKLGCRVQGLAPLTFRIETADDFGLTWRVGAQRLSTDAEPQPAAPDLEASS